MKKGFTLIELLAVIVILAIIALIATPIVLNIINDSKESATLRSAEFYLDGVDQAILTARLNNKSVKDGPYNIMQDGNICLEEYEEETQTCKDNDSNPDNNELIIEVKGDKPKGGTITIANSQSTNIELNYNNKVVIKDASGNLVFKPEEKTLSDLAVVSSKLGVTSIASCATDGTNCETGEAFAIKVNDTETYKFRVLNDNGNKVTLIMSENLGETIVWDNSEDCIVYENPDGDDEEDCGYYTNIHGPVIALATLKTRTSNWTNIAEYNYTLDYRRGTYSEQYVKNVRARLPKISDIESVGCVIPEGYDPIGECEEGLDWLLEGIDDGESYWLSDASMDTTEMAWFVLHDTSFYPYYIFVSANGGNIESTRGIRPVITISK